MRKSIESTLFSSVTFLSFFSLSFSRSFQTIAVVARLMKEPERGLTINKEKAEWQNFGLSLEELTFQEGKGVRKEKAGETGRNNESQRMSFNYILWRNKEPIYILFWSEERTLKLS